MIQKVVWILIDNKGEYVGIHKHEGGAKYHLFHRERKLPRNKHIIQKALIQFIDENK